MRLGLPIPEFVGGFDLRLWQPIDRLWRARRVKRPEPRGAWSARFRGQPSHDEFKLGELASVGAPAFIFIRPPRP